MLCTTIDFKCRIGAQYFPFVLISPVTCKKIPILWPSRGPFAVMWAYSSIHPISTIISTSPWHYRYFFLSRFRVILWRKADPVFFFQNGLKAQTHARAPLCAYSLIVLDVSQVGHAPWLPVLIEKIMPIFSSRANVPLGPGEWQRDVTVTLHRSRFCRQRYGSPGAGSTYTGHQLSWAPSLRRFQPHSAETRTSKRNLADVVCCGTLLDK